MYRSIHGTRHQAIETLTHDSRPRAASARDPGGSLLLILTKSHAYYAL